MASSYRFGWFSSGHGPGSRKLLTAAVEAINRGEIPGRIAYVFSSRDQGETTESDLFLQLVRGYHIPLVCESYVKLKGDRPHPPVNDLPEWRLEYDREVMKSIENHPADLIILAGYMLVNGKEICTKYNMLNLHPAAPGGPKGTWQQVIWKLIETKAERTGVMMHLATPILDQGPVVTFCNFSIRGKAFDALWKQVDGKSVDEIKRSEGENSPLFKAIRQHGLAREFPLVITTMKAFAEGSVRITPDKKPIDASGKPINGYDLSAEIDRQVAPLLS